MGLIEVDGLLEMLGCLDGIIDEDGAEELSAPKSLACWDGREAIVGVGSPVTRLIDGLVDGDFEGEVLGLLDDVDGVIDGLIDGLVDGDFEGEVLGLLDGTLLGDTVVGGDVGANVFCGPTTMQAPLSQLQSEKSGGVPPHCNMKSSRISFCFCCVVAKLAYQGTLTTITT